MDPVIRRAAFLKLSSALCGVAVDSFRPGSGTDLPKFGKAGDLAPRNSPIDRTAEFLNILDENVGAEAVDALIERFLHDTAAATQATAVERLLADPATGPTCTAIMKMWYLGSWFPRSPDDPAQFVISTQAYKEALVWSVMQSHPMGFSMWAFGYWSSPAASLEDFLTLVT